MLRVSYVNLPLHPSIIMHVLGLTLPPPFTLWTHVLYGWHTHTRTQPRANPIFHQVWNALALLYILSMFTFRTKLRWNIYKRVTRRPSGAAPTCWRSGRKILRLSFEFWCILLPKLPSCFAYFACLKESFFKNYDLLSEFLATHQSKTASKKSSIDSCWCHSACWFDC